MDGRERESPASASQERERESPVLRVPGKRERESPVLRVPGKRERESSPPRPRTFVIRFVSTVLADQPVVPQPFIEYCSNVRPVLIPPSYVSKIAFL